MRGQSFIQTTAGVSARMFLSRRPIARRNQSRTIALHRSDEVLSPVPHSPGATRTTSPGSVSAFFSQHSRKGVPLGIVFFEVSLAPDITRRRGPCPTCLDSTCAASASLRTSSGRITPLLIATSLRLTSELSIEFVTVHPIGAVRKERI